MALTQADPYDAFLSYHWRDHKGVEGIAAALSKRGLHVFFDRWYLTPGLSWPHTLECVLERCHAAVMCIGPEGMGPWQLREQFIALARQSKDETFPVIPVLLPGADPPLGFLALNTWIAFQPGSDNDLAIETIARAIRGLPPGKDEVSKAKAGVCPYRGLQAFREEDAPFFFGREAATAKLVEQVEHNSLIALVGASGSGKSSLVRAGLVPRLRAGTDGHIWDIVTLTPGSRPLQALAAALIPILEPDLSEVDRLAEFGKLAQHLAFNVVSLPDVVQRCLEKQRGTDRLLFFVDQWEELYTLCKDDDTRRGFIAELIDTCDHSAVKVVLTLRGDFFGRALSQRVLADRLQDTVVNLGPMTRDELRRTLEEPAAAVGLDFEAGLVDRILDEVGDQPGNLPLLEFVLAALWEKRRGRTLHFEAYEAMKGIKGAIATRADKIFQAELSAEQQGAARRVLMQMVRPGEGAPDTRKRALLPAEDDPALVVVRRLADARLLVTGRDEVQTDTQTVEIAHEALIQSWGLLQQWVNEDREFLRTRERIEAAAALWEQEGQIEDRLLAPGRPLAEAEDLLKKRRADLSASLVRFIESSLAAEQRRQDSLRAAHLRELKRNRFLTVASLIVAIAMTGLLGYAISRKIAADNATSQSEMRRHEAEERRREAELERNTALSRGLAAQASLLAERGQGEGAMLKAGALAVESWRRMPNADAYATAMKLLQWFPVIRIEPDPGAQPYPVQLAFSPDGRFLAVRVFPAIRLIETATGRELWRIEAHASILNNFRFSRDSRLLLIDAGKDVHLISTDNAQEVFSLTADKFTSHYHLYQKGFSSENVSMSPDGRWLVFTAENDGTKKDIITVVDTSTGKEACRIEHPMNRRQGDLDVFFSSNGELLGVRDWPSFHLFDLPGGQERTAITVTDALNAYFIADDRWLVVEALDTKDDSQTLHLFDPATGHTLRSLPIVKKTGRFKFSADGRQVVMTDESEKLVRLLEVPTGKERGRWQESPDYEFFDSSGQWLILKSREGAVLIDTASAQVKSRIKPGCEVGQVHPLYDSDLLVVACRDGLIHTYKVSTGEEKARFEAGPSPTISPDGRLSIAQDKDHGILWLKEIGTGKKFGQIATSQPIQFLIGSQGASIPGMSTFSPDGRYLASPDSQGGIQLVDLSQDYSPLIREAVKDGEAVLSRDHKLLAFSDPDHVVQVIDVATGRNVGALRHNAPAYPVHISSDGRLLTTEQESIMKINVIETGVEVARLEQSWNSSISISPDNKFLVIRSYGRDSDRLVSSSTLKETLHYPSAQLCCHPVFSSDGRSYAMANRYEHIVQVFDTESGAERLRIAPDVQFQSRTGPCCPEFSPDGRSLAVDVFGAVWLFDISTGTWLNQKYQWPGAGGTLQPSFSPDGRSLAVEAYSGKGLRVALFDVVTERELARIHSGSMDIGSGAFEPLLEFKFAFSPDSRFFAVGAAAGDPIRLFEAKNGKELTHVELGWGFAGVLFSPDGRTLAAASNNGSVRLLDVESRRLLGTSQHAMAVTHLEFSPDSGFLVTSGEDGSALMIETQTGREIARFEHGAPVTEAHFSADGKSLLTVSRDKIKIYPAAPDYPFQQLCARAGRNLSREEWRANISESEPWQATCPNWH